MRECQPGMEMSQLGMETAQKWRVRCKSEFDALMDE